MKEAEQIYKSQKEFFESKKTDSLNYRKKTLIKLSNCISKYEDSIYQALEEDLGKPRYETYLSEILFVQKEITTMVKNLKYWSHPKRIPGSIYYFPSKDYIIPRPFGCVLSISPWNYPFQLGLCPIIGAVAAGNTVTLKPSEHSPKTSEITKKIIEESFEKGHVSVLIGDSKEAQALLAFRWDYIFFTGSTSIGKIVAKSAAEFLTPITLELGGKNPCVIEKSAKIKLTAKRIVWAKFLNCGQTCIAPDYLIVHESIIEILIKELKKAIEEAYGKAPIESKSYGRLINIKHFNRISKMAKGAKIIYGGESDSSKKFFSPTLLLDPDLKSGAMKEEIFGPLLPIIEYNKEDEIYNIISKFEKPLGAYIFSKNKKSIKRFKTQVSAGAIVANDSVIQFINSNLPFGGIGNSGVGAYHGKHSFDLFQYTFCLR